MSPTVPPPVVRGALRASRPLFASTRLPLPAKRRLVDALSGAARAPYGTTFATGRLGGVGVERAVAPGTAGRGVLLYLHGGGYALGSARAYRGAAAQLAAAAGVEAVVADYRLAPEHPHPAALDDALAVYTALLDDVGSAERIVVAGDSAGGGLTLALLLALRDRGIEQPAGAGLICPWLDLAADLEGTRAAARDPLVTPAMLAHWARPFAGSADPRSPGVSPLYGDLAGLAPLVVHSAGDDPLAIDARRLEERAAAGEIDHRVYPARWHVFHLQVGFLADADRAMQAMGVALRGHLDDAARV